MDFLNNLDTAMQFLHRYLLSKCDIAQKTEIIICLVSIKCFHILLEIQDIMGIEIRSKIKDQI